MNRPRAAASVALALALAWAAAPPAAADDAALPPLAADPREAVARDRAARALAPLAAAHGRVAAVADRLGLPPPAAPPAAPADAPVAPAGWAPDPPRSPGDRPSPDAEAAAPPPAPEDAAGPTFAAWRDALEAARVPAPGGASPDALRARGEAALAAGRPWDALSPLHRAAAAPRGDDPAPGETAVALTRALLALGAWPAAREALAAAGDSPAAGRLAVDVALAAGDLAGATGWLAARTPGDADAAARAGLAYVRGRAHLAAGDVAAARTSLAAVAAGSPFFGPARYLLGALAVRDGDLAAAEDAFCAVAAPAAEGPPPALAARERGARDLAWLALGRVAHEGGRGDDAFYYYFQVPSDAWRVEAALFEGARAAYEGGDAATAVDLLDQLEVRFPDTPHRPEARLLRGYALLDGCRLEAALAAFDALRATWGPARDALGAWLAGADARGRALALAAGGAGDGPGDRWLARVLAADPAVAGLARDLAHLDAALARGAALPARLDAIAGALGPRARVAAAPLLAAERDRLPGALARARAARGGLAGRLADRALARARRAHGTLAATLRRARLGRIDAIMASRRRIEHQIAALAAGRFPPELFDPLRMQGLLRSDEAYWPQDGEWWADELEETMPPSEAE